MEQGMHNAMRHENMNLFDAPEIQVITVSYSQGDMRNVEQSSYTL